MHVRYMHSETATHRFSDELDFYFLSYRFVAISGMDAEFERVDINQCPTSEGNPEPNLFANTHRCRPTTMVSIHTVNAVMYQTPKCLTK